MADAAIRRLPAVDDSGELCGILTLDDVVATVGVELERINDVIETQSPGYWRARNAFGPPSREAHVLGGEY